MLGLIKNNEKTIIESPHTSKPLYWIHSQNSLLIPLRHIFGVYSVCISHYVLRTTSAYPNLNLSKSRVLRPCILTLSLLRRAYYLYLHILLCLLFWCGPRLRTIESHLLHFRWQLFTYLQHILSVIKSDFCMMILFYLRWISTC